MGRWAAVAAFAMLAACTSRTEYGECVGAFDDPLPELQYKTSGWNIALAEVFVETLVVPAVVLATEARCPVGRKPARSAPPPHEAAAHKEK